MQESRERHSGWLQIYKKFDKNPLDFVCLFDYSQFRPRPTVLNRRRGLFPHSRRLFIRLNSALLLQDIAKFVHTVQQTMLAKSSNRERERSAVGQRERLR